MVSDNDIRRTRVQYGSLGYAYADGASLFTRSIRIFQFKDRLVHDLERMTTVVSSSSEMMKYAPNAQIREKVYSKKPPSLTNDNSQEKSDVSLLENLVTRLSLIEEHVYSLEDVIKPMETIVEKFKVSHVVGYVDLRILYSILVVTT